MTEALKIPSQVVESDWQDDIDFETYGKNDKQEMEYVSPDKVNKVSIEKIKARNERIGHNILSILKQDKLAA
ncbi:hypothetical protein IJH01_02345 [Candidatus Saccharibacteria bacterium]|nr:hypothetical protein [Candidatus Saccharibacteria bacterium]